MKWFNGIRHRCLLEIVHFFPFFDVFNLKYSLSFFFYCYDSVFIVIIFEDFRGAIRNFKNFLPRALMTLTEEESSLR